MTEPLLVLGTGVMALEIADVAEDCGFEVTGFVENLDRDRTREDLDGRPIHWVEDISQLASSHRAICGLATTKRHRFTDQAESLGFGFAQIVHPTARISSRTSLGKGCVVSAGVIVGAYSRLGEHVLVNRGAMIGHHTTIGDHVSIQPGANVAGACEIQDRAWISVGAVVIDRITVGSDTLIAAGAVVVDDLPSNVVAMGVPARVAREGFGGR